MYKKNIVLTIKIFTKYEHCSTLGVEQQNGGTAYYTRFILFIAGTARKGTGSMHFIHY